jgi:HK97 family phage prohead protease
MKYQINDEILFTEGDALLLGVIEGISDDRYSVRVLAETGDGYTALTDRVVTLTEAELMDIDADSDEDVVIDEFMNEADDEAKAIDEFVFGEDNEEVEEIEEAEKAGFGLDSFVEYDSAGGKVVGKVVDIIEEGDVEVENEEAKTATTDKPVYKLEVYEMSSDGMMPSGIMTYQYGDDLKMCDEPKMGTMKHLPRFAGKLKKAEVTEETEIGYIKGYLSIFDNVDLGGDVVKYGAFKRTLDHKAGKIVFMLDHGYKTDEVIGVLELEEDITGLKMVGKVNLKTTQGRNAFETMKFQAENGVPLGASIGYELKRYEPNKSGGFDILEAELWEGSVTPFPMNTAALITEATKLYNRGERSKRARLYQSLKKR